MRETEDYTPQRPGETTPPAPDELPPGLADHPSYRVLQKLGEGGMGPVYRAEHKLMHRPVALKVIRPDLVARPGLVERFRREVTAAAKLNHPNIVAAYDAEQAGDTCFLVMEFVEGTDLARYLARRGTLPVGESCDYVRQAAAGLQHAHEQHMVHRDLKPHNLMRTLTGQVKVLDFGLARIVDVTAPAGTGSDTVVGTPDYMAPEQANDARGTDIRADIYSLGCTLYQLLGGQVPFPGGGLLDKLRRHADEGPTPLRQLRPEVPAGLAEVVARMMAKEPAARYQTPAEVCAALAPWCDPRSEVGYPALARSAPASRHLVPAVLALALVGVLGLAAALVAFLPGHKPASVAYSPDSAPGSPPTPGNGAPPVPPTSAPAVVLAPDLSGITPLADDDFSDPKKSYFRENRTPTDTALFRDGRFVLSMVPGKVKTGRNIFMHPAKHFHENLACQVTARVKAPKGYGWAVYASNTPSRIVAVMMHPDGGVEVATAPWTNGFPIAPVGPIRSPAVRPIEEDNTLLVILRQGQTLEVYVNGRELCPPIRLEQRLGKATPGIRLWRPEMPDAPEPRAEFSRFTLWQLPEPKPPG